MDFCSGESTGGAFRANYTISFFVCLALNLLGLLRLLLIVFKYSVDLVFFRKCFSVLRIALFKWAGVWSMLDVVTSERCSLIFLNIPLLEILSFSKMPVNLIQYRWAAGSFNKRHSARELKYCNLPLQSHYHNNVFADCFFSVTVVSYLYYS